MKKMMLGIICAGMFLFTGSAVSAVEPFAPTTGTVILDKVLMYIPNRIMELLDIFSLDVESGLSAKVGARVTYAFGIGGNVGSSTVVSKGYDRTIGLAYTESTQGYFMSIGKGIYTQDPFCGNLPEETTFSYFGFLKPNERLFKKKIRDYWAIEAEATFLIGVRVAIHPLNIADLICGIFCYDLLGNDYKLLAK